MVEDGVPEIGVVASAVEVPTESELERLRLEVAEDTGVKGANHVSTRDENPE